MRHHTLKLIPTIAAFALLLLASSLASAQRLSPQGGTITSVGATAGGGLTGGATSGAALLGLRTTCSADQVLAWDGDSWECADRDDGGGVDGSGTPNRAAKWCGTSTLCDGSILDLGSSLTLDPAGPVRIYRLDGGTHASKPVLSIENGTTTGAMLHRAALQFLTADDTGSVRTNVVEAEGKNLFLTSPGTVYLTGTESVSLRAPTFIGSATSQSHTLSGRIVGTSTAQHALLLTHTPTSGTAAANSISLTANGTYDTTAGSYEVRGLAISQGHTRSAGGNPLLSTGLRISAFGAQTNVAIHTLNGDNYLNDSGSSTGIGYSYGSVLPAKLSVSGTLTATGAITEGADRVISLAGTGLTKSGRTLSIDDTYVQRRVSGTCAAGSSIREIAADGTVTCETDSDTAAPVITTISGGTGTANNLNCGASTTVCRLSYGTLTATGFVAGSDGQVMDVVYVGTTSVTIQHENTGSTAANRLILPGAQSWTFANGGGWRMVYDATSSRWRVIGPTDRLPSATIAGAATVGTSLSVTGATTLAHSLDVMNATSLYSTLDVTGAATLDTSLDVYGATNLRDTVNLGDDSADDITVGGTIVTHVYFNGSSPILSGCGTGATIAGNDTVGVITQGTSATTCRVTFSTPFVPNPPVCVVSGHDSASTAPMIKDVNTTYVEFSTNPAAGGKQVFYYHCFGRR